MALKIAESSKKPEKDSGIEVEPEAPEEQEAETQEVSQDQQDGESDPRRDSPSEWGLSVTDRFTVVRQKESFMLVEHRPSQDRDGNPTTKTIKTYHPSVEQIVLKMAKVHTLDLLEQEEVDKFVDGVAALTQTLRDTVGPLLEGAAKNHEGAGNLWKDHLPTFLSRANGAINLCVKMNAFEGPDGKKAVPVEDLREALKHEFSVKEGRPDDGSD